jgi:hypothetical protein
MKGRTEFSIRPLTLSAPQSSAKFCFRCEYFAEMPVFGLLSRSGQLPAPPLSTVTERRFCDQHEMSLQTATGRSLP